MKRSKKKRAASPCPQCFLIDAKRRTPCRGCGLEVCDDCLTNFYGLDACTACATNPGWAAKVPERPTAERLSR